MTDTTKKIIIPSTELPPVNEDFNSYFLRYRIVSEDRNSYSAWSPIFEIFKGEEYSASGAGRTQYSYNSQVVSLSWPITQGISEYDVWYKWQAPYQPQVWSSKNRVIKYATINPTNGYVAYTTADLDGNVTSHPYNVGDIVTIFGASQSQYNIEDMIILETPTRNTFIIRDRGLINSSPSAYSGGAVVRPESWTYQGRITGNKTDIFQKIPTDTLFSLRVYVPHSPISHNEDFLVYAILNKPTEL